MMPRRSHVPVTRPGGGGHVRRYGRSIGDSTAELPSVGCVCPRDKPAFGDRRVGTEEETMNRHLTHAWLVASVVVATLGATGVASAQDPRILEWGKANRNFGMDDTTFRRLAMAVFRDS